MKKFVLSSSLRILDPFLLIPKFSKPGFSNTWTVNFQMFKLVLEKACSFPEVTILHPASCSESPWIQVAYFAIFLLPDFHKEVKLSTNACWEREATICWPKGVVLVVTESCSWSWIGELTMCHSMTAQQVTECCRLRWVSAFCHPVLQRRHGAERIKTEVCLLTKRTNFINYSVTHDGGGQGGRRGWISQ